MQKFVRVVCVEFIIMANENINTSGLLSQAQIRFDKKVSVWFLKGMFASLKYLPYNFDYRGPKVHNFLLS